MKRNVNYGDYRSLLRPRTSTVVQDAGFLRRACSLLIDLLLLDLLITAPFTSIFERFARTGFTFTYTGTEMAAVIVVFLIIFTYYVLFEYLLGQTIGMMIMGTSAGGEMTLSNALVRNCFILPFFPFIALWIIEPVAVLFWRRGTLEHITGTRTVHRKDILF